MGSLVLADESTNSKETENTKDDDSSADSSEPGSTSDVAQDDDTPVVIEGEAVEVELEQPSENTEESDSEDGHQEVEETDTSASSDDAEPVSEEMAQEEDDAEEVASAREPVVVQKRASALPLVFGGLVAGGIGYLAAYTNQVQDVRPDTSGVEIRLDELASDIAEIEPTDTSPLVERLDALAAEVQLLQDTPAPTGDPSTAVLERVEAFEADVTSGIEALTDRIAGLEDRLADIQIEQESSNPAADLTDDELANFQTELQQLTADAKEQVEDAKAQVEEAKARATEIEVAAAEAAAKAERKAALSALSAAVESGASFTDELNVIGDAPEALVAVADKGIATVGVLQRAFPDAARSALASSSTVPQDASATQRLTAFLKRQTNARSLAPKEGDDADAVLSRAEAKLLEGDLEAAVSELSALPEEASAVMAPWMAQATTRMDALSALSELNAAN
jgi:hypothetical protein